MQGKTKEKTKNNFGSINSSFAERSIFREINFENYDFSDTRYARFVYTENEKTKKKQRKRLFYIGMLQCNI